MRKYHKKLVFELLNTLSETSKEARKLSSKNLLADCQEGAMELGILIEQVEGEGHITIKYLEEYCELLYNASIEFDKSMNASGIFKKLDKLLIRITNSVKNDIQFELEVVFITYKASMFDSFESIWLAANNDKTCKAYIIPIPFYDKNADGTLGNVYYEGNDYPDYVPVTNWQNYDIEERRPDIIFIHNPYDNANFVTSVHPNYYAERLIELTDMLVYVPYFIMGDHLEEHFAVLPGTIYAHKTIVQSEAIRKQYIRYYEEFEKENNCTGRFGKADDKFLALGSPKFDAVINKKGTDFHLPSEWSNLIHSDNEKEKKVILYNSTVAGLLNGDDKMLLKLRYVLKCFRDNEDVVLLWRPHPLNISTCKAMRPQIINEYQEIIYEYQSEGWGIYDDSPDLHRALAVSDAYYGDGGSLAYLYGATGKPLVIQNLNVVEDNKNIGIGCFSIDDESNIWGCEIASDKIYKLDMVRDLAYFTFRSGSIPRFRGKKIRYSNAYISSCCVEDMIIFLPFYLDDIVVYNRRTKEQTKITLDKTYLLKNDWAGFGVYENILYRDKIYCFGRYTKAVIIIDADSMDVSYNTALHDKIGLLIKDNEFVKYILHIRDCDDNGNVIMLMKNCEHLIRYSLISGEVDYIASNPVLVDIEHADFDGNDYWFLCEKSKRIIKWNPNIGIMNEYSLPKYEINVKSGENAFSKLLDCKNYLLIFPNSNMNILMFDKKSEVFIYYDMPESICGNLSSRYIFIRHNKEKVYFIAECNYVLCELDKSTKEIIPHKILIDRKSIKANFTKYYNECNNITIDDYMEDNLGNVAVFFTDIPYGCDEKRKERFLRYTSNHEGTAGKEIYVKLKMESIN